MPAVSMATDNVCRVGRKRFFKTFSLRVNGDNFTATTSHQQDPVQTLHENLQELHVWEDSSQGVKQTKPSTLISTVNSLVLPCATL